MIGTLVCICFFFFNDTATTEIYTLSLHELFRSLAKEIVAEAVPLDCGVNVTVIALLCPAVIVNGNDTPLRVNSDVLAEADDTVTFDPVALNVAVMFLLCPITTLLKSKVEGLTLS